MISPAATTTTGTTIAGTSTLAEGPSVVGAFPIESLGALRGTLEPIGLAGI